MHAILLNFTSLPLEEEYVSSMVSHFFVTATFYF